MIEQSETALSTTHSTLTETPKIPIFTQSNKNKEEKSPAPKIAEEGNS